MGCARIPVPPLAPKETTELSVTLKSPAETGVHQSKWRMMTPHGIYFGGTSWINAFPLTIECAVEKGSANLRACNKKKYFVNIDR